MTQGHWWPWEEGRACQARSKMTLTKVISDDGWKKCCGSEMSFFRIWIFRLFRTPIQIRILFRIQHQFLSRFCLLIWYFKLCILLRNCGFYQIVGVVSIQINSGATRIRIWMQFSGSAWLGSGSVKSFWSDRIWIRIRIDNTGWKLSELHQFYLYLYYHSQ
jgi:hypothetical protein